MGWSSSGRRAPWSAKRTLALTLALAATLAACSGRTYGDDSLKDVGTGIELPKQKQKKARSKGRAEPSPTPTTRGTIIITVLDERGEPRPNVTVRFTSPAGTKTIDVASDGKGRARVTASPGVWSAEIPTGCVGQSFVTFGGSASRIGVVTGETTRGTLKVEATRRYMPGPPLRWNIDPPWSDRDEPTLRVRLRDVCSDEPVAGHNFRRYMFVSAEEPLSIHSYATRSDAEGWVWVRIRCFGTADGDGSIWFYDRFNERDRVDIMTLTPPVDPNASWCA